MGLISYRKFNKPQVKAYAEFLKRLYNEISSEQLIIDSSKELFFAQFLEQLENVEIYYVFMTRNPKGVVLSRQRKLKKKKNSGRYSLIIPHLVKDSLNWCYQNWRIHHFLKNKNKVYRLRYEDFVNEPKDRIFAMLEKFEVPFEKANLPVQDKKFDLKKNHLLMGNKNRFKRGEIVLKKDTRWKRELQKKDQNFIDALTFIYRKKLGY